MHTTTHMLEPSACCTQRRVPTKLAIAVLVSVLAAAIAAPMAAAPDAHAARKVWSPLVKKPVKVKRPKHLGRQLATWYGPGFWGNRTGCGTKLRTRTWGIAHRSLPCGTLVWLRLRGRSVAVPVVDRGPFSGATIDLTQRTARYLRFKSGKVRMTVLRRRIPIKRL